MESFLVTDSSEVTQARRAAAALARELGFSEEDAGRAALVATEMCTNLLKHAGGGELIVSQLENEATLELLALDKGPGMDLGRCLRDGYSTAGSPGSGLGAIERLSQHFDVYSQPDQGVVLLSRLSAGGRPRVYGRLDVGAVVTPKPGEHMCGDAWCCREYASGVKVMVVDGLGHGILAAEAAAEACRVFKGAAENASLGIIMSDTHVALRSGRGAAVTLIDVDWSARQARVVAIGNLVAALVAGDSVKRMATDNGIVGHSSPRIRELQYACEPEALLILHSDGLSGSWRLDRYPGLLSHSCSVIAGVLYRDCKRGRDDALIVVIRQMPQ